MEFVRLYFRSLIIGGLLTFSMILQTSLWAQAGSPPTNAINQLHELKTGILWVVLPSYTRKIQELQRAIEHTENHRYKRRLAKLHQSTTVERDSFHSQIKRAFNQHYHFSSFDFIQDYEMADHGQAKGLHSPYFYLIRDYTENGADALILLNEEKQKLDRPFPYFVRTGGLTSALDALFGTKQNTRNMQQIIKKLNHRLQRYYHKHYRPTESPSIIGFKATESVGRVKPGLLGLSGLGGRMMVSISILIG